LPIRTSVVPAGKLDLIFRLMQAVTDYYRVPHLPTWAIELAKRETLGSSGVGRGFALLHQFQDDGLVQLRNPPVDWWLVLFPGGIEWGALDGNPVFGMIAHVFPPDPLLGLKLQTWALTSHAVRDMASDDWAWISEADRMTAAQVVNRAILLALQSGDLGQQQ
jgi:hypothetical protein